MGMMCTIFNTTFNEVIIYLILQRKRKFDLRYISQLVKNFEFKIIDKVIIFETPTT